MTGQALPLVCTRILCPRISRREYLNKPGDIDRSWPRTRYIRELEHSPIRMHTSTMHIREQSMSTVSTRPRERSQTVRIREHIAISTVRDQALAADTNCPQTVRSLELSTSANSSRTRILRDPRLAMNCPRCGILDSISSPARFHVHIRMIASYVLI